MLSTHVRNLRYKYPVILSTLLALNGCDGNTSGSGAQWFKGGTLHGATAGDWLRATDANRLATSADFCASIMRSKKPYNGDMDRLRRDAEWLNKNITDAATGASADEQVADICGMIMAVAEQTHAGPYSE
ncbi:MAG TPA: hypothetical protein VM008_15315 [Phycisphaerae bacterium]|nr:hypothetical protein [Phycisphaerae bacterium]